MMNFTPMHVYSVRCWAKWRLFLQSFGQLLFYKNFTCLQKYNMNRLTTEMMQQATIPQDRSDVASPDPTHVFSLKRIDISTAQEVIAVFAPMNVESVGGKASPQQRMVKTTPFFNEDRLHFTPAFMLQQDKLRIHRNPENLKLFQKLHLGKLAEASQDGPLEDEAGEEILIPKPSSSKYCHVCKGTYDDYLTHIRMKYHVANIEKNKFWTDISKLCTRFHAAPAKKCKKQKTKTIKKNGDVYKRNKAKVDQLTNSDTQTSLSVENKF